MRKILLILICFMSFVMFKSNILAAVPTNRIETKNGYAFCRYTANVSGETLVVRTWAYYDKNNNPKLELMSILFQVVIIIHIMYR